MDNCSTLSPLHIDPLRLIEAVTRGRGEPLADIEFLGSVDSTNRWLLARQRDETPYRGGSVLQNTRPLEEGVGDGIGWTVRAAVFSSPWVDF
jgi:hypothetical protein